MHCNTKWSPFASYQTVVQSHLRIGCAGGGGAAVLLLLWLVVPPLPLEVAAPLLADGSTADGGVATRAAVAAAGEATAGARTGKVPVVVWEGEVGPGRSRGCRR